MASHLSERRFLDELRTAVTAATDQVPRPPRFAVAFSGGLDSTVLLVAMTRLALGAPLRALHVDHGLHPDSVGWEQHCRGVAAALDVPYRSMRILVDTRAGSGLEAAAREARYAGLAELLEAGEILLTAHHADDQLETVLLRLLRGAGVRGLRGIMPQALLGPGCVARPMLAMSRADLRARAEEWDLSWLEDPSNRDVHHDRNYLRARVLPAIRARWSAAARSAERLAAAMADAEEILASTARQDLAAGGADPHCIRQDTLRALSDARQRNALRYAIRAAGLSMPTARQLEEVRSGLAVGRPDASTLVRWPGGEARFYRRRVYLLKPRAPDAQRSAGRGDIASEPKRAESSPSPTSHRSARVVPARLAATQPWSGPQGRVELERVESADASGRVVPDGPFLPDTWVRDGFDIRFRSGGERFRPAGDAHTRSLKHWFQDQGIVPWMRGAIPLLYRDEHLVAIADLVVDQIAVDETVRQADAPQTVWCVRWSDHPAIR